MKFNRVRNKIATGPVKDAVHRPIVNAREEIDRIARGLDLCPGSQSGELEYASKRVRKRASELQANDFWMEVDVTNYESFFREREEKKRKIVTRDEEN